MVVKRARLARARKAAGFTQEGFAEAAGVDRSTVVRWEAGGSEPQPYLRPKLAKLLHMAGDELESLLVESEQVGVPPLSRAVLGDGDKAKEREWQRVVNDSRGVVELDLAVTIDIGADGRAEITYRRELLNLTSRPISRMPAELWFEHTQNRLLIRPVGDGEHRIAIQRDHDTATFAKFTCLISPPIQPGQSAVVGYVGSGCQFVSDHYWRQVAARHTRQLAIHLRHRGAGQILSCTASEEHQDGTENSATEALIWTEHDGVVDVTLTRQYLRATESVTLRWDVTHESA